MLKAIASPFFLGAILSFCFIVASRSATATDLSSIGDSIKVYNLARCAANNALRLNGTESNTTSLFVRNFDSVHPITITRLLVYEALGGAPIYDSKILGLPPFTNGILGPNNNTLKPHQSSSFSLSNVLQVQQSNNPLQLLVESSSAASALPLYVVAQSVTRETNQSGSFLTERTRSGGECNSTRRLRPLD